MEFELDAAREIGLMLQGVLHGHGRMELSYDHEAGRLGCAARSGSFRVLPGESRLRLRIFLDRSVMEVYANGRLALTVASDRFGLEGERSAAVFARGGQARAAAVDVWEMTSIWDGAAQSEKNATSSSSLARASAKPRSARGARNSPSKSR